MEESVDVQEYFTRAESEDRQVINDPSEDVIFAMVNGLDDSGNTFLTVEPTDVTRDWYVSIASREEGGYEVEYRDAVAREHEVFVENDPSRVAEYAILWIAGRPKTHRRDLPDE